MMHQHCRKANIKNLKTQNYFFACTKKEYQELNIHEIEF